VSLATFDLDIGPRLNNGGLYLLATIISKLAPDYRDISSFHYPRAVLRAVESGTSPQPRELLIELDNICHHSDLLALVEKKRTAVGWERVAFLVLQINFYPQRLTRYTEPVAIHLIPGWGALGARADKAIVW
jgi:hypothetical protein